MKKNQYIEAGKVNGGIFGLGNKIAVNDAMAVRMTDSAIASGGAFLSSELEKHDMLLREPLSSVTWYKNIPVLTGGGWAEFVSAMNVNYGETGGGLDGSVQAGAANNIPVIQANLGKDIYKTHIFSSIVRANIVDIERQKITSKNIKQILEDGLRLAYDKHMDANTYIGMSQYSTSGLLNNPNVLVQNAKQGAAGSTSWSTKTPDEILEDINTAIISGWEGGGYDLSAIPNHILLPYKQYNYIATTKVSPIAEKTILTFLLENNVTKVNGGNLVISATYYCDKAGAGDTDRMAVYVHHKRFCAMEELVPLTRTMTGPNINNISIDSVYMANVSEVEMFYPQCFSYIDGI